MMIGKIFLNVISAYESFSQRDQMRRRVKCAWKRVTNLYPILAGRGASSKLKGKTYYLFIYLFSTTKSIYKMNSMD